MVGKSRTGLENLGTPLDAVSERYYQVKMPVKQALLRTFRRKKGEGHGLANRHPKARMAEQPVRLLRRSVRSVPDRSGCLHRNGLSLVVNNFVGFSLDSFSYTVARRYPNN